VRTAITRVKIGYEQDVVYVRQRARLLADLLGYDMNDQTRISTAVSEIARNAYQYGGGGDAEFALEGALPGPRTLTITVRDRGPGISDLSAIMEGRYKSSTGMGKGIVGARRLMDEFRIDTAPGGGTTVHLAKNFPPNAPEITPAALRRINDALASHDAESPLEEIRVQNQELLRTLEELSHQRRELEDTNRGVLALYAELDEKVILLQGVDRLKTQFLSHMSHELRAPLNSIHGLTTLLLERADGELNPEQEKQVTFIRKAASELYALVNDLLDLAKIEAGKMSITLRACTVEEIFSGLRGMLRPAQTNPAVELIFEPAETMPTLLTDDGKVSQILRNFISNALKFTTEGSIRVSAKASDDGTMAVFSVADTGIGIASEDLERIFNEYEQVQTAQQGKPQGTGLGLPIARKLAELLGGSVGVQSRPGEGTTFTASIPARYAAEDAEAAAEGDTERNERQPLEIRESMQHPGPVLYCIKPIDRDWLLNVLDDLDKRAPLKNVLIVDDEEFMRSLFRGHLADTHFSVIEAADGAAGLTLAREERPGVIVLDLMMTGMNGFEVLKHLKADPATRTIPVIICTSKTLNEAEKNFLHQLAGGDRAGSER
jgi:signal transduction histidine kinase/CheY-like chemotaxis protein